MKKRSTHNLNFPDFFEKFSFQTLTLDFSDKENNMYLQNHCFYRSPAKSSSNRIDVLVDNFFNEPEDVDLYTKLMP